MESLRTIFLLWATLVLTAVMAGPGTAAPYAAMVIDARNGEVLHSRNADTRLHPASLTKMMTLYVTFEAVENGEISLDTMVKVSSYAASEPPSKLYLKAGQRIALRHLIRAAAVKSANDAATALAEAVGGSEKAFAERMTRTAKALGMTRTTFKNAHGLTEAGHLSTARDMTTLGRHLFYDYPQYYNLFSRRTTNAGGTTVANTNRRFLAAYRGADGIKTGFTNAAGFNLVASAERGDRRIIATMFGGTSTAARNRRVAELLDMGFSRAPNRVAVVKPRKPDYRSYGQRKSVVVAVESSQRPMQRPVPETVQIAALGDAVSDSVMATLREVEAATAASTAGLPAVEQATRVVVDADAIAEAVMESSDAEQLAAGSATADALEDKAVPEQAGAFAAPVSPSPQPRPVVITFSSSDSTVPAVQTPEPAPEAVTVARAAGAGDWGVDIGLYASRYEAERILLKTALLEIETLDEADRHVERRRQGFAATFTGLNSRTAALACQRLSARNQDCSTISP